MGVAIYMKWIPSCSDGILVLSLGVSQDGAALEQREEVHFDL